MLWQASTSETEVELAIGLLLDQQLLPLFDAVRELVGKAAPQPGASHR